MRIRLQTLTALHPSDGCDFWYSDMEFDSLDAFLNYKLQRHLFDLQVKPDPQPLSVGEQCAREVVEYFSIDPEVADDYKDQITEALSQFHKAVKEAHDAVIIMWAVEYDLNATILTLDGITFGELFHQWTIKNETDAALEDVEWEKEE